MELIGINQATSWHAYVDFMDKGSNYKPKATKWSYPKWMSEVIIIEYIKQIVLNSFCEWILHVGDFYFPHAVQGNWRADAMHFQGRIYTVSYITVN